MKILVILFFFITFYLKSNADFNYQEELVIATINKTMKKLKNNTCFIKKRF